MTLIFLIQIAVSMTSVAVQISSQNNNGQYITVDINGNGDYSSIQTAVSNAISGSTIYIKKGQYPEVINIKKEIFLVGEDKDSTIINPISGKNKYAICLGAPGASLRYLSITNGAPGLYSSCVRIIASNTRIESCNLYDTPVGITVWASNNVIDNCRFWGCNDEGIVLIGSNNLDCKNNQILNCVFYDNCDGIELQYSSKNSIINCEFYDNTHTGIDAIAQNNDGNTISDCKIYNNRVHGIYLSGSSDNQIINCLVEDNGDGNIIMNGNSKNNIIFSSSSKEEEDKNSQTSIRDRLRDIFERLVVRISKIYSERMISNLYFNNIKEKYKF